MRRAAAGLRALILVLFLWGCELQETSLTEPEDVLVAEVYLQLGSEGDRVSAFLHRTIGGSGDAADLAGATVRVAPATADPVQLLEAPDSMCVRGELPPLLAGACYAAQGVALAAIQPGERTTLEVQLLDGRRLTGETRIPESFDLLQPGEGVETCSIMPRTRFEVRWTRSPGASAYASEALISGLPEALAPAGIEVTEDPLRLLGLSVGSSDTTIVFPSEFGVFDRFDLDRELALVLQEGLPPGTSARVTVAAADRNYVNWQRGGDFNPSGQVRVPSLQGDGTGVFGSFVTRHFSVVTGDPSLPPCGPVLEGG